MLRHLHHMIEHPRHNLNNGEPLRRPTCAEIVRGGRTLAKVYPRHGEALDAMQARAQRLAAAYRGEVVTHEP